MKLNSKYFDSIRVSARREREEAERAAGERHPGCQWKGCDKPGAHRAPKGRGRDGEYYHFCIDHVRQYNASYNYFDGMSQREVSDFQKDAVTGHRPTWRIGANAWAHGTADNVSGPSARARGGTEARNAGAFFRWRSRQAEEQAPVRQRPLRPVEKKSLEALHLGEQATRVEIKARFKELVKRHHPDANGGDTRSEEKLREIIQAYNYLKQAGLV
jgi:hypothetical protein